ncbi:5-formyltetrahydrofolate cyclo-ligase [Candidatus Woesearchaeota archaeon]|nr:5-formyltetrahydrofolate cyclo-ligase [Candidatus Woesearchaeota archaeon]
MIALAHEKNEKSKIRDEMSRKRSALTLEEAASKSAAIAANLMKMAEYRDARAVMLYAAKGNEVRTREMIEAALKEGKTVLLPITNTARNEIEAGEIKSLNELKEGAFGIMEPKQKKPFDDVKIDLVLVPGIAFDQQGHRLGYGHGFYDKLLRRLTKAARIGLAYDFQVVEKLPRESHDERMGLVITESSVIRCNYG